MKLKFAVLGLAALGCAALASGQALAAMPNGIPQADRIASGPAAEVDQVRWVCNPWGRCFWRPNYYGAYGYYGGPRRFYGPRPWGWAVTATGVAGELRGAARPLFLDYSAASTAFVMSAVPLLPPNSIGLRPPA